MEVIEYERCRLEFNGPLATYVLNNPDQLNAADPAMLHGLEQALTEIKKPRRGVRCFMITGEGRGFCTGANVLGMGRQSSQPRSAFSPVDTVFHPTIRHLRDVTIPIVTAVNGPAVGFGVALAMCGDICVAAQSAYFYLNYNNLASAPDCGTTWFLPRRIGLPRARAMMLRGERVSAETATDWGLINDVFDDDVFFNEAVALANDIAQGPTVALTSMKQLLNDGIERSLDEQLEAEARAVLITSRTKDNVAAMKALRSKEKPEFIGE